MDNRVEEIRKRVLNGGYCADALEVAAYLLSVIEQQGRVVEAARKKRCFPKNEREWFRGLDAALAAAEKGGG